MPQNFRFSVDLLDNSIHATPVPEKSETDQFDIIDFLADSAEQAVALFKSEGNFILSGLKDSYQNTKLKALHVNQLLNSFCGDFDELVESDHINDKIFATEQKIKAVEKFIV